MFSWLTHHRNYLQEWQEIIKSAWAEDPYLHCGCNSAEELDREMKEFQTKLEAALLQAHVSCRAAESRLSHEEFAKKHAKRMPTKGLKC